MKRMSEEVRAHLKALANLLQYAYSHAGNPNTSKTWTNTHKENGVYGHALNTVIAIIRAEYGDDISRGFADQFANGVHTDNWYADIIFALDKAYAAAPVTEYSYIIGVRPEGRAHQAEETGIIEARFPKEAMFKVLAKHYGDETIDDPIMSLSDWAGGSDELQEKWDTYADTLKFMEYTNDGVVYIIEVATEH